MKMRFALRLVVVAALFAELFAMGAEAAPVPPGTVVTAPDWSTGSEWHYSDGYAMKITSVSPKGAVFDRLDAPGQVFTRQGFIRTNSISGTATRNAIYRTVPDDAGASLTAGRPLTFQREYLNNGKLLVHASSWSVEGRETITVPAGTFDCWVIVWRTRSMRSDWTGFERWWYSPQAQNYVRMEFKYGPGSDGSRVLMKYSLAGPAPAPLAANPMPAAPQAVSAPLPSAPPVPAPLAPPKPKATVVTAAPIPAPVPAPVKETNVAVLTPAPAKDEPRVLSEHAPVPKPASSEAPKPAKVETAALQPPVPVKETNVAPPASPPVQPPVKMTVEALALPAPLAAEQAAAMHAPSETPKPTKIEVAAPLIQPSVKEVTVAALTLPVAPVSELALPAPLAAEQAAAMHAPSETPKPTKIEVAAPLIQPSVKEVTVAALTLPTVPELALPAPLAAEQAAAKLAPSQMPKPAKIEVVAPLIQPSVKEVAVAALTLPVVPEQAPAAQPVPSEASRPAKVEAATLQPQAPVQQLPVSAQTDVAAPVSSPVQPSVNVVTVAALAPVASQPQAPAPMPDGATIKPAPVKTAEAKPASKPLPPALPRGDKYGSWHAQLGATQDAANIRAALKKILARNPGAHALPSGVTVRNVEGQTFYRAWLGSYDSPAQARSLCQVLDLKKARVSGCTIFKGATMEARAD